MMSCDVIHIIFFFRSESFWYLQFSWWHCRFKYFYSFSVSFFSCFSITHPVRKCKCTLLWAWTFSHDDEIDGQWLLNDQMLMKCSCSINAIEVEQTIFEYDYDIGLKWKINSRSDSNNFSPFLQNVAKSCLFLPSKNGIGEIYHREIVWK